MPCDLPGWRRPAKTVVTHFVCVARPEEPTSGLLRSAKMADFLSANKKATPIFDRRIRFDSVTFATSVVDFSGIISCVHWQKGTSGGSISAEGLPHRRRAFDRDIPSQASVPAMLESNGVDLGLLGRFHGLGCHPFGATRTGYFHLWIF